MSDIEKFKNLPQKDKNEIIDYYFKEKWKADEMTIIQYLFFKCVWICQETWADNLKLESDLLKINKKASLKFTLDDK